MVVVLERRIRDDHKEQIRSFLTSRGFSVREIIGEEETIFGAVGSAAIDLREVEVLPGVQSVIPITKPYKIASREMKREDSVVPVGRIKIGGRRIAVISGPCSVEGEKEIMEAAHLVRQAGGVMLRGGAYKPRTSPYSFQGLGVEGLRYLRRAGDETGLPVVSEIVSAEHLPAYRDYVDVLQIGARNMQNFELLKAVGAAGMPVIVKRGMAATIEEWLMAAEYLLAHGTENVILCERGIRTFETYTRNTLDISSIPVVKKLSHLPVLADPSHATGIREQVPAVALAAVAAGADGLLVEMHPTPDHALSDGPQSLFPEQLEKLLRDIEAMTPVIGKELSRVPEESAPRTARAGVVPSARGTSRGGDPASSASGAVAGKSVSEAEAGQLPLQVAFQGERGAYSEMALEGYFQAEELLPVPCGGFRAVFDAVLEEKVDYGIVPLENSLAGSIHENYDLFLYYPDVKIVGETKIRIIHSLIAIPGAKLTDIREVYSHPQGLAQCSRFLDDHDWKRVPFYDTAGSVAHVKEQGDKRNAAIANAAAARHYGMAVLKEGIETNPANYTRFAILAREDHEAIREPNKASIVFSALDEPGSLFRCMEVLARRSLNMTKIESRPIEGKPWTYMFYVDIDLPADPAVFAAALEELGHHSEDLRILGRYRI